MKVRVTDKCAAAIGVLDSVQTSGRLIHHTGREMNPADEPHGSRRERRLIVTEIGRRSSERHGGVGGLRRRRHARVDAENRAGAIDDGHRHRIGDCRRRRVEDRGHVVGRQRLRDAAARCLRKHPDRRELEDGRADAGHRRERDDRTSAQARGRCGRMSRRHRYGCELYRTAANRDRWTGSRLCPFARESRARQAASVMVAESRGPSRLLT